VEEHSYRRDPRTLERMENAMNDDRINALVQAQVRLLSSKKVLMEALVSEGDRRCSILIDTITDQVDTLYRQVGVAVRLEEDAK